MGRSSTTAKPEEPKSTVRNYRRDIFEAQSAKGAPAERRLDPVPSVYDDKDGGSGSGSGGSSNSISKTTGSSGSESLKQTELEAFMMNPRVAKERSRARHGTKPKRKVVPDEIDSYKLEEEYEDSGNFDMQIDSVSSSSPSVHMHPSAQLVNYHTLSFQAAPDNEGNGKLVEGQAKFSRFDESYADPFMLPHRCGSKTAWELPPTPQHQSWRSLRDESRVPSRVSISHSIPPLRRWSSASLAMRRSADTMTRRSWLTNPRRSRKKLRNDFLLCERSRASATRCTWLETSQQPQTTRFDACRARDSGLRLAFKSCR